MAAGMAGQGGSWASMWAGTGISPAEVKSSSKTAFLSSALNEYCFSCHRAPQNPAGSPSAHTQPRLSHFLPGLPAEQQSGQYEPGRPVPPVAPAGLGDSDPGQAPRRLRVWSTHFSPTPRQPHPGRDVTYTPPPRPSPPASRAAPQVHSGQMCCPRGGTALLAAPVGRRPPLAR